MSDDTGSTLLRPSLWLRGGVLLAVLVISLIIALNHDQLREFKTLGYAGIFLIMLLSNATVILPAPGLMFVFALGSTFNPILIGFSAAAGGALGEMTGYLTGYSGLAVLENSTAVNRIKLWMQHNGGLTILLLSTIPNPLFDVAGILAGTSQMRVRRFLGAVFCGKLIQGILIALAGKWSLDWVRDLVAP
ncbi:MAG: VTT domain-containing protein [Chloroflexi bacterium]|nr:VTT domain-containing protein [Chloroflexota bacterium]